MKARDFPNLGIGIGLRIPHYEDIFRLQPAIDWFEIISENFMVEGGKPLETLDRILERYPVVQHGVTLAIGSPAPLDFNYLKKLKDLTEKRKLRGFRIIFAGVIFPEHIIMIYCLFLIQKRLSIMFLSEHISSKTI